MTKAYLMGFIARLAGKDVHSYANHWFNPFAENFCLEEDKEEFKEFEKGWNEADSPSSGMEGILKLAKQKHS